MRLTLEGRHRLAVGVAGGAVQVTVDLGDQFALDPMLEDFGFIADPAPTVVKNPDHLKGFQEPMPADHCEGVFSAIALQFDAALRCVHDQVLVDRFCCSRRR